MSTALLAPAVFVAGAAKETVNEDLRQWELELAREIGITAHEPLPGGTCGESWDDGGDDCD